MSVYCNLFFSESKIVGEDKYGYIMSTNLNGKKIYLDKDEDKDYLLSIFDKSFKNIKKNLSKIMDYAANDIFVQCKESGLLNDTFKTEIDVRKKLKIINDIRFYSFNPSSTGKKFAAFDISFDTVPSIDPHHLYTLHVDVDLKDNSLSFDSEYDG